MPKLCREVKSMAKREFLARDRAMHVDLGRVPPASSALSRLVLVLFWWTTDSASRLGLSLGQDAGLSSRGYLSRFSRQLAALGGLGDNWDSYGAPAPNATAMAHAEDVLEVLWELDLEPTSVGPCADGGVAIAFTRGNRAALLECFNSGEITSGTSNGPGTTRVHDVMPDKQDLRSSLEEIRDYLERLDSRADAWEWQASQ
jgi:hypothetical protein